MKRIISLIVAVTFFSIGIANAGDGAGTGTLQRMISTLGIGVHFGPTAGSDRQFGVSGTDMETCLSKSWKAKLSTDFYKSKSGGDSTRHYKELRLSLLKKIVNKEEVEVGLGIGLGKKSEKYTWYDSSYGKRERFDLIFSSEIISRISERFCVVSEIGCKAILAEEQQDSGFFQEEKLFARVGLMLYL